MFLSSHFGDANLTRCGISECAKHKYLPNRIQHTVRPSMSTNHEHRQDNTYHTVFIYLMVAVLHWKICPQDWTAFSSFSYIDRSSFLTNVTHEGRCQNTRHNCLHGAWQEAEIAPSTTVSLSVAALGGIPFARLYRAYHSTTQRRQDAHKQKYSLPRIVKRNLRCHGRPAPRYNVSYDVTHLWLALEWRFWLASAW